ncbi:hypothetical protein SAMN06272735_8367 [Streptomyces sp. TLI_55]|nr:hypothetical protein SAMN06272735_8367 [Streptomyces sp. TLI_55]
MGALPLLRMSTFRLFHWYVVSIITQYHAATDRAPTPFDIMNVVQVADSTKLATPVITVNPRGTVAPLRLSSTHPAAPLRCGGAP